MNSSGERIQKVLANLGVASRRQIENWVENGRITINGRIAKKGDRIHEKSRISIDGKPLKRTVSLTSRRILLYNKPEGEICTRSDPAKRPTVFRNLPALKGERWVVVGRLDINTRGLLFFCNDGNLANKLMHPSMGIEREYLCRVFGNPDRKSLEKLKQGINIDGETMKFLSVRRQSGENSNAWYSITLTEGKYREIRRMWSAVGCKVSRLSRIRYGNIALPRGMKPGDWLELKDTEIDYLLKNAPGAQVILPKVKRQQRRGKKRV